MRQALERSHEYQLALRDLVAMQNQLARNMFDRGDAVDDVFVVAGGVRSRALRFSFPGSQELCAWGRG